MSVPLRAKKIPVQGGARVCARGSHTLEHRGDRNSIGVAAISTQVMRKVAKKGFDFCIMAAGAHTALGCSPRQANRA